MAPGDGSLAERCAVADADLVPVDADVLDAHLAALGLSAVAAWMVLTGRARLGPGRPSSCSAPAGRSARRPSAPPGCSAPAGWSPSAGRRRRSSVPATWAPTRSCHWRGTPTRSAAGSPTPAGAGRTSSSTRCSGRRPPLRPGCSPRAGGW
ncbi:hypothetical protein U6N30_15910 [Blastococcus brunescens]|uniref:Uncharacterized protein n=1 Tax=Blastococcus brunescens TaxID=1564165 RepID=A0ABZ1B7L9_9ACTN|nr:hypothetical protein [Blastococcus sp. BMG 8361]WRL66734.1 hypothetical protein U6N30_15910 [Blastococcus sp. BMG 8361]